eukprot:scaffold96984_cov18-Phaeocystis_antarctica.AAC.1
MAAQHILQRRDVARCACACACIYLGDELLEHLRIEGHLLELEGEGGVRLLRVRGRGRGRGRVG